MNKVVLIADEPVTLIADELGVTHDCPLCGLPFAGFGQIADEVRIQLEWGCRDLAWIEAELRKLCDRRDALASMARGFEPRDAGGSTRRDRFDLGLRRQIANAARSAERIRAQMRDLIAGRTPAPALALWGD